MASILCRMPLLSMVWHHGHSALHVLTAATVLPAAQGDAQSMGVVQPMPPVQERDAWEPMRGLVDLLLELGGDLSATDALGNDFVAIAASAYKDGMWTDIIKDPGLLTKCTSKHAGRIALQLLHCFITEPREPPARGSVWWCGEFSPQ